MRGMGIIIAIAATVAVVCIALSAVSPAAAAAPAGAAVADAGKAIFLAQKCNLCHGVSSAGIAPIVKSPAMQGPDLAGVVAEKGADWAAKFLKHQVNLNDKPHKKEWTASDQDLQTLIGWLGEQKKAAK
jgi:mono/diheme cytochrome c family protein